jgi:hypothetical protein
VREFLNHAEGAWRLSIALPIDFGDIDPSIRQQPVQLYAADFGKSHGILYMPATICRRRASRAPS